MIDDPIGKLFVHKRYFYVIRVEAWLPGPPEEWMSGQDPYGDRHTVKSSELLPLSEEQQRRFAPMFERGRVIVGPWRQHAR